MAFDRLIENIIAKQNPTVAGLDPKLDYVPASIKNACFEKHGKTLEGAAAALLAFNKAIIDRIYDIVPAIKRGMDTVLITNGEGIENLEMSDTIHPTYIVEDLSGLTR